MKTTTIALDPLDAAIILKQDGSLETSFPDISDTHLPENVLIGAALAFALQNRKLCEAIRENFENQCSKQYLAKQ